MVRVDFEERFCPKDTKLRNDPIASERSWHTFFIIFHSLIKKCKLLPRKINLFFNKSYTFKL